jgi:hypothetical protein
MLVTRFSKSAGEAAAQHQPDTGTGLVWRRFILSGEKSEAVKIKKKKES